MSNSGMISDCDADRRHRGDLGLLQLEESLKACFAFLKPNPFLVHEMLLQIIQNPFNFYNVSVTKSYRTGMVAIKKERN